MLTKESIRAKYETVKKIAAEVSQQLTDEQSQKLAEAVLTIDFFLKLETFDRVALRRIMDECEVIDRITREHAL